MKTFLPAQSIYGRFRDRPDVGPGRYLDDAWAASMTMARDIAVAEAYLEDLLEDFDVGPRPERVSEEMADQKIRFEIAKLEGDKQQAGLWSIHKTLKDHGVPPGVRLHLVSAVVNLSLLAAQRRASR